MPGCSATLVTAASMTGSTNPGPIQPQQDLFPFLDDSLFTEKGGRLARPRLRRASRPTRNKMSSSSVHSAHPVQLTPLWEYVVRTKKFPKDADVLTIFEEISDRLSDPEWEVRQHALRVLVDVLPTLSSELIDDIVSLVLPDLIDNLGNPAPAVKKGSLDAIRIYLLHTPRRNQLTKKILQDGLNRSDVLDNYQTNVARGVILSTPLLLFPSRSSTRPSLDVIREATQALAMRLVQVTHQESALRSLAKIRDAIGLEEFNGYLVEIDDTMKRNFELLCNVYEVQSTTFPPNKRRSGSKSSEKQAGEKKIQRRETDSSMDAVIVSKGWENKNSGTLVVFEENVNPVRGVASARIVLETEIKFDEETAITMTILEEREKVTEAIPIDEEELHEADDEIQDLPMIEAPEDDVNLEEQRKTPRRVHFGGEIVKLRTPDSEDADSVASEARQRSSRTRIPLPVSPATRMPSGRRTRSFSHPSEARVRSSPRRRSSSSSPKRETYTHDASLSPKKSILTKSSDFTERRTTSITAHISKRDFDVSALPPRASAEQDDVSVQPKSEPSFRVYEEPKESILQRDFRNHRPSLLGDICGIEEVRTKGNVDYIFGDRSGYDVDEKILKEQENFMRSMYRSKSAPEKTTKCDWTDEDGFDENGKERRRSQSAKIPGFEVFPRQERNYILMELSSPTKDTSRRTSLEDNASGVVDKGEPSSEATDKADRERDERTSSDNEMNQERREVIESGESHIDSNKRSENDGAEDVMGLGPSKEEASARIQPEAVDEDVEKAALDAKERLSDTSSDGEWKSKEPSWEELGLVDDEVLNDFHNKDDWRARVRGLEHIACALRSPLILTSVEPRLGSLLNAVLGGERSCRVAAAGLAVAKVVLTGVSEETLKNHLSLIAWGLARQGGPNAAHLARLTMLRTSPGLFLEKLLQPQCIGARNAKMRENTLQLLIFSLVTFPSTEFKVKSAIDKVIVMVGDPRKRVRHSALDALAVISQIYESENILEASKRFTKGRQDGLSIQAAIKTRLSRKLLPTVSMDGLVVYGLQVSSNYQNTGPDVDWIIAGRGSVSPGTGRTRGQLIAMPRMENNTNDQNFVPKKAKSKSASEPSNINSLALNLLEKNERTSSWKLLPLSNTIDDTQIHEIQSKKLDRAFKSANLSKELRLHKQRVIERDNKFDDPYSTPKRTDKRFEFEVLQTTKLRQPKRVGEYTAQVRVTSSAPVPRHESRIPIYTGARLHIPEMNFDKNNKTIREAALTSRWEYDHDMIPNDSNKARLNRKKVSLKNVTSAQLHPISRTLDNIDLENQGNCKQDIKNMPLQSLKETNEKNQRTFSYEKLNKGFDRFIKMSNDGLKTASNHTYSHNSMEDYETIFQRQSRFKKEQSSRIYEPSPAPVTYKYDYSNYSGQKKNQIQNSENKDDLNYDKRNSWKRQLFCSPFDSRFFKKSEFMPKEETPEKDIDSKADEILSGLAANVIERVPSPTNDVEEVRSSSSGSSSSNRSASSGQRVPSHETLLVQTESEESSDNVDAGSRPSSSGSRSDRKAFDVISAKSNPSRSTASDHDNLHSEVEVEELEDSSSSGSPTKLSLESLIDEDVIDDDGDDDGDVGDYVTPVSSRPPSLSSNDRDSEDDKITDFKMELKKINGVSEEKDSDLSKSKIITDDALNSRNAAGDANNGAVITVVRAPVILRPTYPLERSKPDNDASETLYKNNNQNEFTNPTSVRSSPKIFINDKKSTSTTNFNVTPPLPIGFDTHNRIESSDGTDETDNVNAKPQSSRMHTAIDMPRRACKVSPSKAASQVNRKRATSLSSVRHNEKHVEKTKLIPQIFEQLENKEWEVTLKGLKSLLVIAKEDPDQLESCAPGLLARVIGKQVKNLRSQVARLACSTAKEIFSARIRGIDQDIDEIAGPLLHRTADTNKFLREDCNSALDSMVEHFPSHRTIMTISNRGASHQNPIVHATTARLLLLIVNKISPDHVMSLPRESRDKLFATTAKLITDGNLQARKYAKETLKLLSQSEGFRKILTDAVPENTLRFIEKTLKSL